MGDLIPKVPVTSYLEKSVIHNTFVKTILDNWFHIVVQLGAIQFLKFIKFYNAYKLRVLSKTGAMFIMIQNYCLMYLDTREVTISRKFCSQYGDYACLFG